MTLGNSRRALGNSTKLKLVRFAHCLMLFALCVPAQAQQQKKVPLIGWLSGNSSSTDSPRLEGLRQGLSAFGYVEGKNIALEYRYADAKFEKLPALADELLRLNIDVFVTVTTPATQAAKSATKTTPIVFLGVGGDPIAGGLIDSLARPGGNLTGFTNIASVLAGKRLELLKGTVPKLSRVAVLWNPQNAGSAYQWKESQVPARELGLQLHSMEVSSADRFEIAFKEAIKARSAALAVTADPITVGTSKRIIELTTKNLLPAIYPWGFFVDNGGLMSYGPDFAAEGREAARLVDKILTGTKPADLPVEQPTKFELLINLKAANQIGVTIPQSVLFQATKVVK